MFHEIIIVGRLGRDPEMQYMPNGKAVTSFSLASNHNYTDSNGERVNEVVWFKVSVFGRAAETCKESLRKSSRVLVTGRLRPDPSNGCPRVWQNKDGEHYASYDVAATTVRFLERKPDSEQGEQDEK